MSTGALAHACSPIATPANHWLTKLLYQSTPQPPKNTWSARACAFANAGAHSARSYRVRRLEVLLVRTHTGSAKCARCGGCWWWRRRRRHRRRRCASGACARVKHDLLHTGVYIESVVHGSCVCVRRGPKWKKTQSDHLARCPVWDVCSK